MAACPCCGDPLPAEMPPDQLCPVCVRAMETGSNTENLGVYGGVEQDLQAEAASIEPSFQIERPIGITLIALVYFVLSVFCGIGVIAALARYIFGHLPGNAASYLIFNFSLCMFLAYWFGRAFCRLRDWARVTTIFVLFMFLIVGGAVSDWWIRGVDILLILYLISNKVKASFYSAGQHRETVVVDRWLRSWQKS